MRNDIWIGLRKQKHIQIFDSDPILFQPLQEDFVEEFEYSDGMPFNPETMYKFGAKSVKGECFSLKQSADYEFREGSCTKEKSFICLWTAPECPEEYHYVGQLSDGRTCHAALETGKGDFSSASCANNGDLLRTNFLPSETYHLDRFRRFFVYVTFKFIQMYSQIFMFISKIVLKLAISEKVSQCGPVSQWMA